MFSKIIGLLLVLGVAGWGSSAHAILMFSDVSVTNHSVTFTVDGDMNGYTSLGNGHEISIQYKGDLWIDNSRKLFKPFCHGR